MSEYESVPISLLLGPMVDEARKRAKLSIIRRRKPEALSNPVP